MHIVLQAAQSNMPESSLEKPENRREVTRLQALSAADRDPNNKLMLDLQALYAANTLKDMGGTKIDGMKREACIFEIKKTMPHL